MNKNQISHQLVDLLVRYDAFRVGLFTLKNGTQSPYFINFGRIADGAGLAKLGELFAIAIHEQWGSDSQGKPGFETLVGPAYKGIALAAVTGTAYFQRFGFSPGVTYNRKETKGHGEEKDSLWNGTPIRPADRVVVIDDVFTNGGTKVEIFAQLRSEPLRANVVGVVVGVDRQQGHLPGGEHFSNFGVKHQVQPLALVNVSQVVEILLEQKHLLASDAERIKNYIAGQL